MKKNAFSYVELIIAMVLIIALMAASGPLIARREKKATGYTAFGQYECWVVNEDGNDVFYERRVDNGYDLPDAQKVDSCSFHKPRGATMFKIQLVGGGAGGEIAIFNQNDRYLNVSYIVDATINDNAGEKDTIPIKNHQSKNNLINLANFGNAEPLIENTSDLVSFLASTGKYKLTKYLDAINVTPGQGGGAGEVIEISIPLDAMPFNDNGIVPINLNTDVHRLNGTSEIKTKIQTNVGGIYIGATAAGAIPQNDSVTPAIEGKRAETGFISYIEINNTGRIMGSLPNNNCADSNGNAICFANGGDISQEQCQKSSDECALEQPFGQTYACINGAEGKSPTVKILREDQANDEPIEVAVSNPTPGGTCDNMNEQYSGNTFNYSTCTPSNDCTKLTPNAATNMGSGGGGAAYITDKNAQSFQLYLCANNTKETRTYKTSFGSNKNTWEYWSGLAGCIKTANERNSFSFREVQGDYTGNGGRSGGGGVIITW